MDNKHNIEAQLQQELQSRNRTVGQRQLTITETLRKRFDPDDYVTIRNPFEWSTGWAYVNPKEAKVEQPDTTTRRVYEGESKFRILKKGDKVVVRGWEAYIAVERMFKEYAQEEPKSMSAILASAEEIDAFIKRAVVGKFDPMTEATTEAKEEPKPVDPLGFADQNDNEPDDNQDADDDNESSDLGFAE